MNINIAQEDPPNVVERVAKDVGRGVIEAAAQCGWRRTRCRSEYSA